MEDRFEEFVHENRAAFDDKEAPAQVWIQIEKELEKTTKKTRPIGRWLSIAAIGIVLLGVGALFGQYFANQNQSNNLMAHYPEVFEVEQHYKQQVDFQIQNLSDSQEKSLVEQDLSQLDAVYQELKNELFQSGVKNEEKIVEAMIQHYKTKLEILELVAKKINHKTQDVNNYESIDI